MTRILITGSTGFLGGAVVAQLLEQGRIDEVLLLVRASITAEAMSRIAQRLQSFKVSEQKIALLKPVHFLLSDISHLESFIGGGVFPNHAGTRSHRLSGADPVGGKSQTTPRPTRGAL